MASVSIRVEPLGQLVRQTVSWGACLPLSLWKRTQLILYMVEGDDGLDWAGLGKEGRAGQGKEKTLQAIVEETLQNVVKKCEKKN